jgi:hypothetical protein
MSSEGHHTPVRMPDGCTGWHRREKMGGKSDSEAYKAISKFDRGIADRWWAVTERAGRPGNVHVEIGPAGLQEIIGDLGSSVTPSEAGAIDQLTSEHRGFTDEALKKLSDMIALAHNDYAIWRGASRRLSGPSSGPLPRNVTDAFRHIAHINFISPVSNFRYLPSQYLAVLELIRKGEIYLYEVQDHGLTVRAGGPRAYYDRTGDPRKLVINQERYTGTFSQPALIHECTHAIQDWAKVPGLIGKHAEADAFVWVGRRPQHGEDGAPGLGRRRARRCLRGRGFRDQE